MEKSVARPNEFFCAYMCQLSTRIKLKTEAANRALRKGEMNMNSPKDKVEVVNDAVYVILGGGGNTGSIIANSVVER